MSSFGHPYPFDGLSPFSEEFKNLLNEMAREVHSFHDIHEDLLAKLLEIEVAVEASSSTRIHLARITAITHEPDPDGKPKYKAISIDTSRLDTGNEGRLTVPKDSSEGGAYDDDTTYVTPLTRPVPPTHNVEDAELDGSPAGLGELCFIVIDQDDAKPSVIFHGLMLWESAKTQLCPSVPGQALSGPLPGSIGEQIAEVLEEQRRSWG